ncbi:ribonuclease H-like domain-containing protein [Tanacetum coccineum]
MFVHNFDQGDDYVEDPVTLISKLDISDPLHLHPNDSSALTVVSIKLKGTKNYQKKFDAMVELPKCVCNASESFKKHNQLMKLMQFLMGLYDSYMQIRSSILFREVLRDVRSAYASISSEESHRVASGSIAGSSQKNQAYAFVSNVPNINNFQRNNQNMNSRPRPDNLNNNRQGGGSGLVCENCGFNGHTINRCFKIIGYPVAFGKKKPGQKFKGTNISNNNFVGTNSSSEFTNEQMATLISLIKGNKNGKNVQVNTADNVLDISHLKIKVGHPNRTEAFISKIGNLKLSNDLTLYDVLVIPEYYDLNLRNVMGTGNRCEELYYYNSQEPVLNALKDSLQFDNKDQTICCEICQRAKQSREPFPLSDHTSKSLDENTADFSNNSGNDVDSSEDIFSTQNKKVTVLEVNIFSEGNLDQNPSTLTQDTQTLRRSSRQSVFPKKYNDFVAESKVKYGLEKYVGYSKLSSENYCFVTQLHKNSKPKSFDEASKFSHWTDVMNKEMDALLRNDTWDIVDLPKDRKVIGSKWIFKIKYKSSDEINRFKARSVAQGFGQKEGIDYDETFSHVVKMVTVRFLLNIVVSNSWHVFQLDVNNAFLYGDLAETVCIKPLEGYFPSRNKVCRLKKSLYGLKQPPRQWNAKLTSALIENGFSQSKSDYSLYTKSDKDVFLAYMDDNLGRKYVLDLLSDYGMFACKPTKTPLMSKLVIFNEAFNNDPILDNVTDC